MHIFFADDSTQNGMRQGMGKLIAFGGLLLHESQLKAVGDGIDQAAKRAGAPDGTEIKWSPPPTNWFNKNCHGDARTKLFHDVLDVVAQAGGKAIVVVWDEAQTVLQGDRAFEKVVDFVFERATTHLTYEKSTCIMVADKPGGGKQQEATFLDNFVERVQNGTAWVKPDRVLLNVLTTPSRLLRHLQAADVIVGSTTAMIAGNYKYSRPVFDAVKPLLVKNKNGTIGGAGVKVFPNESINVYRWALGESHYVRVGMNAGWPLPIKGQRYEADVPDPAAAKAVAATPKN
jgi:hypothetical protein